MVARSVSTCISRSGGAGWANSSKAVLEPAKVWLDTNSSAKYGRTRSFVASTTTRNANSSLAPQELAAESLLGNTFRRSALLSACLFVTDVK
jgi:hypothetical protein